MARNLGDFTECRRGANDNSDYRRRYRYFEIFLFCRRKTGRSDLLTSAGLDHDKRISVIYQMKPSCCRKRQPAAAYEIYLCNVKTLPSRNFLTVCREMGVRCRRASRKYLARKAARTRKYNIRPRAGPREARPSLPNSARVAPKPVNVARRRA